MPQLNRYIRQLILPQVGTEGQARLARAHVLIVGAGGLGCPVLQYLAGAGIGRMTLIDPDHVEESNLHRQPLYRMSDLGRPKVRAANDHLIAACPDLQLETLATALTPANAASLVAKADLVIDAADSFAVSYILSDECLAMGTPLISASVAGQSGYVGGFCARAPSLRAVFPDLPSTGATCAETGVMGPVVGLLGTLQAQFALQVLLKHDPSPMGRLVSVDMAQLYFGSISFLGAPEPDHGPKFIALADVTDCDQVFELRDVTEEPALVCPQAKRASTAGLETVDVDFDHRIVVCCKSGLRAWHGAKVLRKRGHTNLALIAAGTGP